MSKRASLLFVAALAAALSASVASAQEKSYKIGYIADLSGPMQDNFAPVYEAFDFYVKDLNARGGINGVPVRLFVRDDGLDATRASSAALELITSEGVNSIWGMSQTRTHLAVYQVAARNKAPAVAMFSGIKEVMAPKPLPYAYSAGHVFEVAGEVSGKAIAQTTGGKGMMICNSIQAPGGVAACQYAESAAKAAGLQTGTVLFPPTLTEFGAIAQRMMAMKPTIVAAHAPAGQNVGLIRALRGAGFDGPILLGAHGLNEAPLIAALQGVGGLGKVQILSRFASPDDQGKEVSALRAAAAKYGKKSPLSTTSVMGWSLGRIMEASLKKCGYPCSGEQLNTTLEGISVDMGSLMGAPVKFSPTDHVGPTFWRIYQFDEASKTFKSGSKWVEATSSLESK
jgi:branched-chain amino acid transport system substrate-binding protein